MLGSLYFYFFFSIYHFYLFFLTVYKGAFNNDEKYIFLLVSQLHFRIDCWQFFQMGLYNFRPSVRPVPLEVHIAGFPGKHYCPRMATMNKPTFQGICFTALFIF